QYIVKIPTPTLHRVARMILEVPLHQLRELEQPSMLGEPESRSLVGLIEYLILQRPHWGSPPSGEIFSRDAAELLAGCPAMKRRREAKSMRGPAPARRAEIRPRGRAAHAVEHPPRRRALGDRSNRRRQREDSAQGVSRFPWPHADGDAAQSAPRRR